MGNVTHQHVPQMHHYAAVMASGVHGWVRLHAAAGFNLTLKITGTNTSVKGPASEVPAASLQPVQPVYSASVDRLNLTVRLQGADVVPFTASLQRELVSALLHVSCYLWGISAWNSNKPEPLLYVHACPCH